MRHHTGFGLLLMLTGVGVLGGCALMQPDSEVANAETKEASKDVSDGALVDQAFVPQLLRIGKQEVYLNRISATASWAPIDCMLPGKLVPLVDRGTASGPHGRKLYFLLVSNEVAYRKGGTQPVGQTIVKESWHPRLQPPGAKTKGSLDFPQAKGIPTYAQLDGKIYVPGDKGPLFVMVKREPRTPGTDQGWVYATLTPEGERVTAAGRLPSCMGCHEKGTQDRLFRPRLTRSR